MAADVKCPFCGFSFAVVEAFAGSRVTCPQCAGVMVLDFQVEQASRVPLVPPGPKILVDNDRQRLVVAAVEHLSSWLDVSPEDIKLALSLLESNEAYEEWKIPKGTSGYVFRDISAPKAVLKNIQRRVLDRLLYRIPVSNAAHGFVQGRSIVTNAHCHLPTASAIFNVDLKGAFPSVKEQRIKHLLVRYLKIPLKHLGEDIAHPVLNEVIDILVKITTHQGCLPQGSPTSGCLLNIACLTLDKNIFRLLKQYGMSYKYTRYADDMTISAPKSIPLELRNELEKTIRNCGFQVNPQKVHYAEKSKGQKLEVTGLILEKGKVRIATQKMEVFRAMLHRASLLEVEALTPEKKLEIQSVIAFVKMVYDRVPHRLWVPYKAYLEKHRLSYPRAATRPKWQQYPK